MLLVPRIVFNNPNRKKSILKKYPFIENITPQFSLPQAKETEIHIPINWYISKKVTNLLKDSGGRLISVFYNLNTTGKIGVIKKIKGKISKRYYFDSNTPILNEFKKNKKEFYF